MFAAIYLPHKLHDAGHETIADVSLNDFHLDVIEYAKSWPKRLDIKNKQHDCFIAPRMTGKSTWVGHILPIWAGAHYHKRYVLFFSDNITQAERWLMNFKMEIDNNSLLQEDFPEFCGVTKKGGKDYLDNRHVTMRGNGLIFQVAGADTNVLGANINGQRPEVLIFDDIEPTESNYSDLEARKRLNTVLSAHFYLNPAAIKAFIGTTTMPNSIIDQMRKVGEQEKTYRQENEGRWNPEGFRLEVEPDMRWVFDHGIKTHYWPAIVEDDGVEESLWPEKWTMEYLNSIRGTREFLMNMMNKPVGLDGGFWSEDDILIDEPTAYGNTLISLDPAVTTKRTSDYTGITVVSRGVEDGILYVRHAEQVKYTADQLREHVDALIEEYDAKVLYIETNQGGDLWKQVFSGVKAKFVSIRQTDAKHFRAGQAHDIYRKNKVRHVRHFPVLEEQMLAFPRVPHDDVVDAVVSAVLYFNQRAGRVGARQINYMEAS